MYKFLPQLVRDLRCGPRLEWIRPWGLTVRSGALDAGHPLVGVIRGRKANYRVPLVLIDKFCQDVADYCFWPLPTVKAFFLMLWPGCEPNGGGPELHEPAVWLWGQLKIPQARQKCLKCFKNRDPYYGYLRDLWNPGEGAEVVL